MKTLPRSSRLLLLVLISLVGGFALAGKKQSLEVPDAVRQKATEIAGKEADIEFELEQGKAGSGKEVYEAEWEVDGKERCLELRADGTVLSEEAEIDFADLPKAVQEAVEKALSGEEIEEVEKTVEGESITYEIETENREILVDATGKILEDDDDDDE